MTKFLTAGAIALLTTAAVAIAAPAPTSVAPPEKAMARGEVQAKVRAHFAQMDIDKDGAITTAEVAARRSKSAEHAVQLGKMGHGGMGGGHMIAMADANHDGRITLAEAEAMALQHFDKMDANHDGQVTRDERRAGRPMMIKMH